ncbi:MAG: methyltransferase domain-containing protein [Proteobacteria bacterium]|nr:methyltransferase domain-containing protein [Pseudomonadota bacterium]
MTSGNMLADRRLEMARALHERGDRAAAAELLEQALELAPDWVGGHFLLAGWLEEAGRRDDAVALYRRCLGLDPRDRVGAVVRLALLGAVAATPELPQAYVAGVFDDYAERFEAALVERLAYRVPAALHDLVAALVPPGTVHARVLDLGCGTGLAGERFRASSSWLEGVDLSEGMVALARRKSLYDDLEVGEAVAFAGARRDRYDLVVAADVLVYMGELSGVMGAVAGALVPGGRFALSVEATEGEGYRLTAGHRYAHSRACLLAQAGAAGLVVESLVETTCRLEAGVPLRAYLAVVRRPAEGTSASEPASAEGHVAIDRPFN